MGDVPHVRFPKKRQRMVLAQPEEMDRAFHDLAKLAVSAPLAFGVEGFYQFRITIIAFRLFKESRDKPPRGIDCRRLVQIHPEC